MKSLCSRKKTRARCSYYKMSFLTAGLRTLRQPATIQQSVGIPAEEEIHTVIALGYPDEVYQRVTGRNKVTPRYFEG